MRRCWKESTQKSCWMWLLNGIIAAILRDRHLIYFACFITRSLTRLLLPILIMICTNLSSVIVRWSRHNDKFNLFWLTISENQRREMLAGLLPDTAGGTSECVQPSDILLPELSINAMLGNSLTISLIHSLTLSLTHLLTRSLTFLLTHLLTHSLAHLN